MTKNIPAKWHKITLITVAALVLLDIVAAWVAFGVGGGGAIAFGGIMGSFLTLALIALFVLLFIDGQQDHKKYSYIFGGLTIANLLFFILALCFREVLAFPIIQTFILLGIVGFGAYFWIKSKFTFRTKKPESPQAPTPTPVEQPNTPEQVAQPVQQPQQEEPKETKSDIVSL